MALDWPVQPDAGNISLSPFPRRRRCKDLQEDSFGLLSNMLLNIYTKTHLMQVVQVVPKFSI